MSIDMAALPQAARPEMEPTRQALRFRPPCEPPPARDARQLDVRQLTHEHLFACILLVGRFGTIIRDLPQQTS